MEPDTNSRLARLEEKIDAIYTSVEQTRKYFQITMWVSLAVVVLPILGLLIAVPVMMRTLNSMLGI